MREVLFNTGKIVAATTISIFIAIMFNLEFSVSAGIVTMLTIQPTKRETLQTAFGRLVGFAVALLIAAISFGVMGYTMPAYCIYLIFYVFICQMFKWYNSMAVNSVLISHFLTFQSMGRNAVLNETMIFFIGVVIGVLANLHLHKDVNYIEELKESTDNQIRNILSRMSVRIMNKDISDYNGECFIELKNSIRKAKNVADENYNNQFRSDDIYDKEYIRMREKQCQVLYEMYKSVRKIETTPITAKRISEFLELASNVYNKNNTGEELMAEFKKLDNEMKNQPLPKQRKEFEDRAELYVLLRHIEEFISLKTAFAEKYMQR